MWEITESQMNPVNDRFCQFEDTYLGHVKVYSLQVLKRNQWLKLEVINVIFDHVTASRSDNLVFHTLLIEVFLH